MRRFALVLALLVAACSKVDPEHYARIHNGMTEQQVYDILGKPDETSSGGFLGVSTTSAKWVSGNAEINVQFVDGKVVLRSFDQPRGK
ncbi:MAG TPA: outer membrane protein assembly factor BamE [Burkholderiales bacterium]|nr:outer membrane protein assembly factor BamE [Burkholderiales bacterium]